MEKKLTRSQEKKKFKTWEFFKICEEDFFWLHLNKLNYKATVEGANKFTKWIKSIKNFYKSKTIKRKRWSNRKRYLFYVWRLSDVRVTKKYRRKKWKTTLGVYLKKFRYYYNNINISRIKMLGSQLNKTFWSHFQSFFFTLETRLDVLACRFHFCKTTREAKHFVQTQNLCVNGKIVNLHYFNINLGDIISIRFSRRKELQMQLLCGLKHTYNDAYENAHINYARKFNKRKSWLNLKKLKKKNGLLAKQLKKRQIKRWQRLFAFCYFKKKFSKNLKKLYIVFNKKFRLTKNNKKFFFKRRVYVTVRKHKKRLLRRNSLRKTFISLSVKFDAKQKRKFLRKNQTDYFSKFIYKTFILYNYPVYFEVNWRILKGILVRQRVFLTPGNVPMFTHIYPELSYNLCLR